MKGTLIYLHIPKCAGSSMMDVLRANYKDGWFRTGNGGAWRKFHKRPKAQRAQITCLTGHMPWGLHQHVREPVRYVTMLRNPVERIASLYWFIRRFTGHRHHSFAKHNSLVDFATSNRLADLDNGMVRWVSGRSDCGSLRVKQAIGDQDLQLAMTHIAAMPVVGFVEIFNASLLQMANQFGWKHLDYERRQVGKPHREIMPDERQAIAERNRFDMALYEYALGLGQ